MKYVLNLADDKRILSVWHALNTENYENMVIVDRVPENNIYEYQYIDDQFIHNPLPVEELPVQATTEERLTDLESALNLLLEGATE